MPEFVKYSTMHRSRLPKFGIDHKRFWVAINGKCYSVKFP